MVGACAIAEQTYNNPVLSGFYPDPSICRAGDDYYLVTSTFEYFPGVPIFHSRDLVHWQQIGHVLTRPSQLPLEKMRASGGIFAPTIRYHDGVFYMVTTNVWGIGNFYVTAKDPAGPWSEPIRVDQEGIDPSLFFDDDGTAYYCRHVGGGDGFIGQAKIDLATGKLDGELKEIGRGTGGVWPEGPHVYKRNGKYYLMVSEGGTSYGHMVTIGMSDSPMGPFTTNPHNPILTHSNRRDHAIQALGHADLVETPDGWWAVCLGIRPQGGLFHFIGRETYLGPVTWSDDGWPVVGDGGHLELEMPAPKLPPHPWPADPVRDEFDSDQLGLVWNFLRNPRDADWSLKARKGFLRLKGSAVTLDDQDSPAFVGRRQTALSCRVEVKLSFDPGVDGEEAGLVVRGNDGNHFELGVTRRDGNRKMFFRQVVLGTTVEAVDYVDAPTGDLHLTLTADPTHYRFALRGDTGPAFKMGVVDCKTLASETIGGFTGAYFGMYATGNGKASTSPADVDWFDYEILER